MKKTLVSIAIILLVFSIEAYSQVSIIANKSVGAGSIDKAQLKNIYTLDLKKLGGAELAPFDLSDDGGTKDKFYSFIGISAGDIKKIWLKLKLNGTGTPPKSVGSDSEMLEKVKSTPGAIGYVSSSKVTGDVKVLLEIK